MSCMRGHITMVTSFHLLYKKFIFQFSILSLLGLIRGHQEGNNESIAIFTLPGLLAYI